MTSEEIEIERLYRIEERLGILAGAAEPTAEQVQIAISEAEQWVKEAKNNPTH
jgi:hypothetical protein